MKTLSLAAAIALASIGSSLAPIATLDAATAAAFSDVGARTPYAEAIASLKTKGIVRGYANNAYKPGAVINRAEFLKIVLLARHTEAEIDELLSRVRLRGFPDVDGSAWYARYVHFASAKGIVSGYPDGTFHPENPITIPEAAKIIAKTFEQDTPEGGTDWYEPFLRALEAGRAIPPTVQSLVHRVTRGEMAEMIWRLTEGKTDLASKGYLNVKYPEATLDFSADRVQVASRCADLSAFVQEAARGGGGQMMYMRNMLQETGGAADGGVPAAAPAAGEKATADRDYSQTNVQVVGVDEGDVVKTDGTNVYAISQQKVRIVRANPAGSLQLESTLEFKDFSPTDLYIHGKTLIILGQSWDSSPRPMPLMEKRLNMDMVAPSIYPPIYSIGKAEARLYDVSNPASPKIIRTVAFEGNTVSTRMIGDKLYMVIQQPMHWYHIMEPNVRAATEADLLPTFDDSKTGDDQPVARCGQVSILPHVPEPEYITVAVVPTDSPNGEIKREVVVGNAQNIYASLENLYVAMPQWQYHWDARGGGETNEQKTNVYRFAFDADGISFQSEGSVPGHILNQFSMDEHDNTFRIATTTQQWTSETNRTGNHLFVLNMELDTVGSIRDIAPGETIYSVRFMGDRAYMVTFKQVDPLFVIDTSDPRNPTILGKLKIPGYSNYLHPYDENHLIGFGKEAVEAKEGDFAWYQGMKVAIFDVTDVENPRELHNLVIGDRGTDSPLLHTHKALLFDKERGLLAFPITIAEIPESQKRGGEPQAYGSPVFQGAHVYKISLRDGFELQGAISHYNESEMRKAGDHWYPHDKDVERIIRIDDSLLTLSPAGIQSHEWPSAEKEGELWYQPLTGGSCPLKEGATYTSRDPEQCKLMQFVCIATMRPFFNECGCGCEPI